MLPLTVFEQREKNMEWNNRDGRSQHSSHTHAKTHLIKRNQHAHSEHYVFPLVSTITDSK